MKHNGLTDLPNFRDLGGPQTAAGRHVRGGLIYRSAAVLEPTDAGGALIAETGIVLVCDLRGKDERSHAPNSWWQARGVEILELDILADLRGTDSFWSILRADPSVAGAHAVMTAIYRGMPEAAAPHLATIFARIAVGDIPLLIHCTAGKDRTGFLSAIILHVLGVPYDAIVEDYLDSAKRGSAAVSAATRRLVIDHAGPAVSEAAMAAIIGVERDYLDAAFTAIAQTYGSIDDYVAVKVGISAAHRDQVQARMLA